MSSISYRQKDFVKIFIVIIVAAYNERSIVVVELLNSLNLREHRGHNDVARANDRNFQNSIGITDLKNGGM